MISMVIKYPGGPDALQPEDRPIPVPGPQELLIRVVAAGVNRPDVAQRKGNYPPPLWASPDVPGLEVSGIVEAIGPGCMRYSKGDEVCALLSGGGYAEYAVASESHTLPLPPAWSITDAAGFPETTFTVWQNVFQLSELSPKESILIHGGTSGIGVTAIQMAKAHGVIVFATCSSTEKCLLSSKLGANHTIHRTHDSFSKCIEHQTDGRGVDVILDMAGGPSFNENMDCLAMDGRLALINFMGGSKAEIDLSKLLRKRLTITGSTLRNRSNAYKAQLARSIEDRVFPWTESGSYKPVTDTCLPLQRAAEAHARMEAGLHCGKMLLLTDFGTRIVSG